MITSTVNIEIKGPHLSQIEGMVEYIGDHIINVMKFYNEDNHKLINDTNVIPVITGEKVTVKVDGVIKSKVSSGIAVVIDNRKPLADNDVTKMIIVIHAIDKGRARSITKNLEDHIVNLVSPVYAYTGDDNEYLIPQFQGYVTMKVNGTITLEATPVALTRIY